MFLVCIDTLPRSNVPYLDLGVFRTRYQSVLFLPITDQARAPCLMTQKLYHFFLCLKVPHVHRTTYCARKYLLSIRTKGQFCDPSHVSIYHLNNLNLLRIDLPAWGDFYSISTNTRFSDHHQQQSIESYFHRTLHMLFLHHFAPNNRSISSLKAKS